VPRPRPRVIGAVAALFAAAAFARADEKGAAGPPAPAAPAAPVAPVAPAAPAAPAPKAAGEDAAPRKPFAELTAAEREKRLRAAEAELSRNMGSLKTLRASFVQRKHLEVFGKEVESRGVLSLAVPGKLRWEFATPVKSALVVNGDRGLRERTSRRGTKTIARFALADDPVVAGTAGQVFLWTRGDFAGARKDFALELVGEAPLRIRATPKGDAMARVVASVELAFSEDRKSLVEVVLVEANKARTVISFTGIERDVELAKESFEIGG
jgi:outer membrane lipoprotein-sorting protein